MDGKGGTRLHRHVEMIVVVLGLACGWLPTAAAQPATGWVTQADLPPPLLGGRPRELLRQNYVGIVTGAPGGVYAQLGNDLMRLLNDRAEHTLRVGALIGQGSVNNVADLRHLPRVDFAILQSDVIEAYERSPSAHDLRTSMRYVSRLHTEFLHIVSRQTIIGRSPSACGLAGRRMNVAGLRSGTALTVRTVLNDILQLGVRLDASDSTEEGFAQLERGETDAVAFIVGKPAPAFERLDRAWFHKAGFVFVPVPLDVLQSGCDRSPIAQIALRSSYETGQIVEDDYPGLLPPDKAVDTIGVPAVLAAYAWDRSNDRYRASSEFVKRLFRLAPDPRAGLGRPEAGFSRQWCGVDLARAVKGWSRHDAAEEVIRSAGNGAYLIRCRGKRSTSCQEEFDLKHTGPKTGPPYLEAWDRYRREHCG